MKLLIKFVAVCLAASGSSEAADPATNVIVFLVDDLGWRDLGCQGSEFYQTPNIDRLASEGVRFTNAYAACAVCSPTRASLLTGKYPARLMLTQWLPAGRWDAKTKLKQEGRFLRSLPLEELTLAEALRKEGYTALHVGKWHLGGPPISLPEQHGFDVNVGGSYHGAPGGYFFPYQGDWVLPTTDQAIQKTTLPDGKEGEYLTDRLTDEAISLLKEYHGGPFFLYFPFYAVHTPLQGKKELVDHYRAMSEEERQGNPVYAAMVETLDQNVGRVLATIESLGLKENTLIVFTSDNGGFAGATDHAPLRANKGSHYEGGIRVPLIIAGPRVRAGAVSEVPTISADLYPTILEMAGLPARPLQHLDGASLAAHLTEGSSVERESLFWHYPHYNRHPENAPVSIIRKGHWKLIEFLETGDLELYDLESDIGESINLVESDPEKVEELKAEVDAWKTEVGADPMRDNPAYEGSAKSR
ncbi:MAG: sulfatase [Verrucomicrobiota bacterium]